MAVTKHFVNYFYTRHHDLVLLCGHLNRRNET